MSMRIGFAAIYPWRPHAEHLVRGVEEHQADVDALLRNALGKVQRKGKRGEHLGEADPDDILAGPVTKVPLRRTNQWGYILHTGYSTLYREIFRMWCTLGW